MKKLFGLLSPLFQKRGKGRLLIIIPLILFILTAFVSTGYAADITMGQLLKCVKDRQVDKGCLLQLFMGSNDFMALVDKANVDKKLITHEVIPYRVIWEINKFNDVDGTIGEALKNGADVMQFVDARYATEQFEGNIALREGITQICERLTGALDASCTAANDPWDCCTGSGTGTCSTTLWDATNAYLGVGDTNTAEAATHTGLQAPTNKDYNAMDSGYPKGVTVGTGSYNSIEFRATWGTADGNFAWEEYSVSNTSGGDTGININRKISSKGTKVSGETWTLSLKICFGTECT